MITQSEAIFKIFKKNGIKDKSYLSVKDFGNKFKTLEPYNAHCHERILGKGFGKSRLSILVDYNGLQVFYATQPLTQIYKEIDPIKLRSIIAFFNCSKTKQETIMRIYDRIEDIGADYEYFLRNKWKLISPLDKSFGKIYQSVNIS
jgi:hypothetical protein